jgi:hypothetical protein
MYAETTNPDFVNPFSETLDDPKELYKKIDIALKKPPHAGLLRAPVGRSGRARQRDQGEAAVPTARR